MNSIALAQTAYQDAQSVVVSGRDLEYRVFARATRGLTDRPRSGPTAYPALVEALQFNTTLWSVLAQDVASENNGLSKELRGQIFYLYEFVRHHSKEVRKGVADVGPLVDVNRAVMRGLRPDRGSD